MVTAKESIENENKIRARLEPIFDSKITQELFKKIHGEISEFPSNMDNDSQKELIQDFFSKVPLKIDEIIKKFVSNLPDKTTFVFKLAGYPDFAFREFHSPEPDFLTFIGHSKENLPVQIVQHVSQVNFSLVAVPLTQSH